MAGLSVVQYVGFGLNGDDENRLNSLALTTTYELNNPKGEPVAGGVYDLRLGTTDHKWVCTTCSQGKKLCPGHRGRIELRSAVLQPAVVAEVRRWLRIICLRCGELLVDREKFINISLSRRFIEAAKIVAEGRRCPRPGCGAVHPRIVKDDEDHFTFWTEPPTAAGRRGPVAAGQRVKLTPNFIRAALQRVPDEAVEALGRGNGAHPRQLALTVICVPPNTIRPSVKHFGGAGTSSFHDSTNLLQNIVKRNGALPVPLPAEVGGDLERSLQNLQQLYFDLIMGSSSTNATQGSGGRRGLVVGARPVKSFMRNLPRKEGRIRANLLGGRVVYISRSTISGNMRYRIDEVGVPLEFARTLQVKETVQEFNRDWLMPFFLNGLRQYPGCTRIVRRDTGETYDVAGLRTMHLEVGDIIYRDVVNGDLAYFNRQPTLERSSIGVHRVVVIQDPSVHTFQMNVLACDNYNADFDGDQMNLWVARNPGARAEAMIMSPIANWFISTKTGGPVNGEVQDSILGSALLTRAGVVLDKYHAMALFATAGIEPPRFDLHGPDHLYTGREIASMLFSTCPVNYHREPSSYNDVYAPYVSYDPSEIMTVVKHGVMTQGVLDKEAIGAKAGGGLFHLISREYGSQRALDMVYALQQIALQFLLFRGFTVGTADLLPGPGAREQIRELVASVLLESDLVTQRLLRGEILPPLGSTVHEHYERMQIDMALKVNDAEMMRWILGSTDPRNNGLFIMISTGAKGKNANFIHISGAIGQTTINNARIREQFAFRRTGPYFPRFAMDPVAYGFVANNYITGMRTSEFIAQDMNGRYDLITKSLSTASTGYFMRKGVMNNQSSVIDNYRRVSKDRSVVQFLYGEDGLDSRELERVPFRTVALDDAALAAELGFGAAPGSKAEVAELARDVAAALERAKEDRDAFRRIFFRIEATNFGRNWASSMLMPVNIGRIVEGVFIRRGGAPEPPLTAAGLSARIRRVGDLCGRLPYILLNEIQARRRAPVPAVLRAAAQLLQLLARAELSPKVLARMSDEELTYVVDSVCMRYSLSLVDYGTCVGVLAAQSIAEPLTQYMLDSHHRSVVGGTNKSGLVRVQEIFGGRPVEEEQSPAMLLPLRAGVAAGAAQEIANSIEYVTLRRFTRSYEVLLEPYNALCFPPRLPDAAWIAEFERNHPLVRPPSDLTNWCFRFTLDKSVLVLKAVDLELIVGRLRSIHTSMYVVHTQESRAEIAIRVWARATLFKKTEDEAYIQSLLEDVLNTPVRGIRGILHATAETVVRHRAGPGGALVEEKRDAISVVGTNLYGVMLHRAIDASCAISTSIGDTYKLYGIEAARAKIVSETRSFMGDNAPNFRHLYIYADEMTRLGRVTSIERGGLAFRERGNVLLRMAMAAPIGVVTDAALAGTRSHVYGMAAPQLLGSIPQIGTLYNSCVVDEKFVRENTRSVDRVLDEL